jgi:hypothetical protein
MTTIAANPVSANFVKPELKRALPLPSATEAKPTSPSVASKVTDSFSKAGSAVVNGATKAGSAVANGATKAGSAVADGFSKAGTAAKGWHGNAVNTATAGAQASGIGVLGGLKAGAGLAGGVAGIGSNAVGLVNAIKNGEGGQAIAQNALGLGRGILGATKGALDTAAVIESARGFGKVGQAAKDLVGNQGRLSGAIANAAAEAVHNGKALRNVDVMASIAKGQGVWGLLKTSTQMATADILRQGGFDKAAGKIENSVTKAGQKAADAAADAKGIGKAITSAGGTAAAAGGDAAHAAANAAKGAKAADAAIDAAKGAEAALKVGAKGAGTAARLAGRFAPGLNIAMAGVDTAIAARTLSDPKASIASKVTSSITAAGSIAAATNIPIVSQVGAAVSAVSSVTGLAIENAGKIKDGFKKLGNKIKSLF